MALEGGLDKPQIDKVLVMKSLSVLSRIGLAAFGSVLAPVAAFAHGGHSELAEALHGVFHAGPLAAALAVLAVSVVLYRRSR
jgi:hypothetical protein